MANTLTHEEHVLDSIRKMGSIEWINHYFDLVKKILTQLHINGEDPRLCLPCTKAGLLPIILGRRYILHPMSEGKIKCIVPASFNISPKEGKDKGWYFSPKTSKDAKWIELNFKTGEALPEKIEKAIISSCKDILTRSMKSSHRNNHSTFIYDFIMDPVNRVGVCGLIDLNDFEWNEFLGGSNNKSDRAYLLTWNPDVWPSEYYNEIVLDLKKNGSTQIQWSCGNSKKIKTGDPVYLMRVGKSKPGIVGSGYSLSTPFVDTHYNDENRTAKYIEVEFDTLLDINNEDPVLNLQTLKQEMPGQLWTAQASGTSIKSEYVDKLDKFWFKHKSTQKFSVNPMPIVKAPTRELLEGGKYSVVQTRYERDSQARQTCLDTYGYKCNICTFDFEKKYGPLGRAFIHVHHIIPVSEIGRSMPTNPEKNLIPVCPNCHAMLHRSRETMHPDTLREIIKNRNQEA